MGVKRETLESGNVLKALIAQYLNDQKEENLFWQDNTGITIPVIEKSFTPYYDLMGRPVNHPTRGIYIKDGRKIVIK